MSTTAKKRPVKKTTTTAKAKRPAKQKTPSLAAKPIEFGKTLFKVLKDGRSFHGGNLAWSLPTEDGDRWIPGEWHEVSGGSICGAGVLHVTTEPAKWYAKDAVVFVAECEEKVGEREDKQGFRKVRLLRPLTTEELERVGIYLVGEFLHKKGFAIAMGNATVKAWGNATVTAMDNSQVTAMGNATVTAWGNATVTAMGQRDGESHLRTTRH